ncbi:MAG: hypothetical protein RXR51_06925 [Nitrososphaeria archaeon]
MQLDVLLSPSQYLTVYQLPYMLVVERLSAAALTALLPGVGHYYSIFTL